MAEEEYYQGIDKCEAESFVSLAKMLVAQKNMNGASIVLAKGLGLHPGHPALKSLSSGA